MGRPFSGARRAQPVGRKQRGRGARSRSPPSLRRDTRGSRERHLTVCAIFGVVIQRWIKDWAARVDPRPRRTTPCQIARTLAEHERVYEAMEAGDPIAARVAMEEHILGSWRRRRLPDGDHHLHP
ncbi:FCD domain-containing protein [Microbacterium enclense]|uniref:FCD domain-containing protein n=1 Tax=Microbacterium enclense TaxID=993073 RepID=UPI003F7EFFF8